MGFLMAVPGICVCAALVPLLRRDLRRVRVAYAAMRAGMRDERIAELERELGLPPL